MDLKNAEQKLQVLQFQNQKLSAQLEAQRKEINSLEEKVAEFEQQQQQYSETLLCVNRLWDELNKDVAYMTIRSTGVATEDIDKALELPAPVGNIRDPFLLKLLGAEAAAFKAVQDKQKFVNDDLSDVEAQLVQRCNRTRQALARLLESIDSLKVVAAAAAAPIPAPAGESGSEQVLASSADLLGKECATLRKEVDKIKGGQRALEHALQLDRDRALEADQRMKRLENELADKEQELALVQKKYYALKSAGVEGVAAGTAGPSGSRPSITGGGEPGAYGEEVGELKEQLARREQELEAERELHLKAHKKFLELQAQMNDESWAMGTRLFEIARNEKAALLAVLDGKQKELEAAMRERDAAMRDSITKSHQANASLFTSARLESAELRMRNMNEQLMEMARVKQELEVQLQREREKLGAAKTVNELKIMVATLQKEANLLQDHVAKNKIAADTLEAASRDVSQALAATEAKAAELASLQDKLRRKEADVAAVKEQEAVLKERIDDLKAFVEVLTLFCNDSRDIASVRASETVLRDQVAKLKSQLEGHELQRRITELEASVASGTHREEALSAESERLRLHIVSLNRQLEQLTEQLAQLKAACNAYIAEIEVTGSAYEEMQAQNTRLLQQLTERDDVNNQLVAERIKLNQAQQGIRSELEAAREESERLTRELNELSTVRDVLDKQVVGLLDELGKANEKLRASAARIELLERSVAQRDEAVAAVRVQLEGTRKSVTELSSSLEAEQRELKQERSKRQRTEDELKGRMEKLRRVSGPSPVVKELEEEVDELRKMLYCNVCHERRKNVIITKCFHMFCQQCIDSRLQMRNRKCPGCAAMFGAPDVKQFFFT